MLRNYISTKKQRKMETKKDGREKERVQLWTKMNYINTVIYY